MLSSEWQRYGDENITYVLDFGCCGEDATEPKRRVIHLRAYFMGRHVLEVVDC